MWRTTTSVRLIIACGCCWSLAGCDRPDESMPQLDALPGLRQSQHAELRAELSRLVAERATPELLEAAADDRRDDARRSQSADAIAKQLDQVVRAQQVELELQRIDKIYPPGKFRCDPVTLENLIHIRTTYASELEEYRRILGQDGFQFRVALGSGLLANLSFLDHARFIHRLEAIDAAAALAENRLSETMLPVNNMFRIDLQLGKLKHVASRLAAADLRAEAFGVIAAIVEHAQCSRAHLLRLATMVEHQLASWPPDADAWLGDRVLGLHAYELVRAGHLLNILTSAEIREMRKKRELEAFIRAVGQSIDDDEWFYLQSMRQVIESCQKPFFARQAVFREINDRLFELRDTPRYPLFAARFLLKDIGKGHRKQAVDRARCESWALALATAVGRPTATYQITPVTGDAYQITRNSHGIEVRGIDAAEDGDGASVPFREERGHSARR